MVLCRPQDCWESQAAKRAVFVTLLFLAGRALLCKKQYQSSMGKTMCQKTPVWRSTRPATLQKPCFLHMLRGVFKHAFLVRVHNAAHETITHEPYRRQEQHVQHVGADTWIHPAPAMSLPYARPDPSGSEAGVYNLVHETITHETYRQHVQHAGADIWIHPAPAMSLPYARPDPSGSVAGVY